MVRRAAARVAVSLALFTAVVQSAPGQTLARLTVESFDLAPDTTSPKLGVPFHLVLTLRVRERVSEVQNINLPILAELELLGDERETATRPHGTLYRETITVVARTPGTVAIAPATLLAIDARDGRAKEWYSNSLRLRVVGAGANAMRTGARAMLAASLAALWFILWLLLGILGIGCLADGSAARSAPKAPSCASSGRARQRRPRFASARNGSRRKMLSPCWARSVRAPPPSQYEPRCGAWWAPPTGKRWATCCGDPAWTR